MNNHPNEVLVRTFMERAFHQGDLSAVDEYNTPDGVDHQEPLGTDFIVHLKRVIVALRTAFPDLHFEIHDVLAEGDNVAFRATMTGTHQGTLSLMPGQALPATGRQIAVPHMYFMRIVNGKTVDLWHLWNAPMMLTQLGVAPAPHAA